MTATNIFFNFVGFRYSPALTTLTVLLLATFVSILLFEITESNPFFFFFESEEGDCNAKKSVERKLQEVNILLSRVFLFTISGIHLDILPS